LQRFFRREGDHYRIRREVRDSVLFATHSLMQDPPFSRLDLISCRNLLIYLDRDLQEQVCATLAYALVPGGFLFLGSAESADRPPGLFQVVDREARIFRSNATRGRSLGAAEAGDLFGAPRADGSARGASRFGICRSLSALAGARGGRSPERARR